MNTNEMAIWFYSLSTTAQVLAALTGLFAVFVVFKLQSLSSNFEDVKAGVANLVKNYSKYHPDGAISLNDIFSLSDKELLEKFDVFLKHYEIKSDTDHNSLLLGSGGQSPLYGINYSFDRETFALYKTLVLQKQSILKALTDVLSLSSISILTSIIFLSSTDKLEGSLTLNINLLVSILAIITTIIKIINIAET
jgi:hypothetical protein